MKVLNKIAAVLIGSYLLPACLRGIQEMVPSLTSAWGARQCRPLPPPLILQHSQWSTVRCVPVLVPGAHDLILPIHFKINHDFPQKTLKNKKRRQ